MLRRFLTFFSPKFVVGTENASAPSTFQNPSVVTKPALTNEQIRAALFSKGDRKSQLSTAVIFIDCDNTLVGQVRGVPDLYDFISREKLTQLNAQAKKSRVVLYILTARPDLNNSVNQISGFIEKTNGFQSKASEQPGGFNLITSDQRQIINCFDKKKKL